MAQQQHPSDKNRYLGLLFSAINHGDVKKLGEILSTPEGASALQLTLPDGKTFLHLASALGRVQVAEMIMARLPFPMTYTSHTSTPLHEACTHGHLNMVRLLLDGTSSSSSHSGESARLGSSSARRPSLQQQKKSLEAVDEQGQTPLHCACRMGHVDVALELRQRGSPIHLLDERGWTPFHAAHASNHRELVDVLLQADFNHRPDTASNSTGTTASTTKSGSTENSGNGKSTAMHVLNSTAGYSTASQMSMGQSVASGMSLASNFSMGQRSVLSGMSLDGGHMGESSASIFSASSIKTNLYDAGDEPPDGNYNPSTFFSESDAKSKGSSSRSVPSVARDSARSILSIPMSVNEHGETTGYAMGEDAEAMFEEVLQSLENSSVSESFNSGRGASSARLLNGASLSSLRSANTASATPSSPPAPVVSESQVTMQAHQQQKSNASSPGHNSSSKTTGAEIPLGAEPILGENIPKDGSCFVLSTRDTWNLPHNKSTLEPFIRRFCADKQREDKEKLRQNPKFKIKPYPTAFFDYCAEHNRILYCLQRDNDGEGVRPYVKSGWEKFYYVRVKRNEANDVLKSPVNHVIKRMENEDATAPPPQPGGPRLTPQAVTSSGVGRAPQPQDMPSFLDAHPRSVPVTSGRGGGGYQSGSGSRPQEAMPSFVVDHNVMPADPHHQFVYPSTL